MAVRLLILEMKQREKRKYYESFQNVDVQAAFLLVLSSLYIIEEEWNNHPAVTL